MKRAPRLIYLLRKSVQGEAAEDIPVLDRNDFPLRFVFKGEEVAIGITPKGNIEVSKTKRLTGTDGE